MSGTGSESGITPLPVSILFVDDEPELLKLEKRFLERSGHFSVTTYNSAREALNSPEIRTADVIVSDYQMPGMDGIAFLTAVREKYGDIPFILITVWDRVPVTFEAINNGATYYLRKNSNIGSLFVELSHIIHQAITRKKMEIKYRSLADQSPDMIIQVDRNFHIRYGNRKISEYAGISPERLIGTDSRKYFTHEDNGISWTQAVQKVFETGIPAQLDWEINSGTRFDCLVYPEFDADNTVQAVTSSIRDITRLNKNEEERAKNNPDPVVHREFREALLDAIPIPVYWKDTNRRYLGCNHAFAEFIGMSPGTVNGKRPKEIWRKNEVKDICIHDRELISTGSLDPYHAKLTDGSGKIHDVIISKKIFRDSQGDIAGVAGSIQDISENSRLISDLKNRDELFRMIITQSSDIFMIITPLLEISFISPRYEYVSGYLIEEVAGSIKNVIHPDYFIPVKNQIENLMHNPCSSEVAEFRIVKRDGTSMTLEGVAVNCLDNPAIRGILLTLRDIPSPRRNLQS